MSTPESPKLGAPARLPLKLSRAAHHRLFLFCCNNTKNLRTELAKTTVHRLYTARRTEGEVGQ